MRVAIIDDEISQVEMLRMIIKNHISNAEYVGCAHNKNDGVKLILNTKPDLVFLDIQLGSSNAFSIIDELDNPNIAIVFSTAYKEYTLQALQLGNHAVDYILKPILIQDVIDAYVRISLKLNKVIKTSSYNYLIKNADNSNMVIDVRKIIYLRAQGHKTLIHHLDKTCQIKKNLKTIHEEINFEEFFRVNKYYVINILYIKTIENNKVIFENYSSLDLTKGSKSKLIKYMQGFKGGR